MHGLKMYIPYSSAHHLYKLKMLINNKLLMYGTCRFIHVLRLYDKTVEKIILGLMLKIQLSFLFRFYEIIFDETQLDRHLRFVNCNTSVYHTTHFIHKVIITIKLNVSIDKHSILNIIFVISGECSSNNCVEDGVTINNKWTLPLLRSGDKKLYLGIFFKVK